MRIQNLRKKELTLSSHIKEFHRLCIGSRMVEPNSVKVAKYLTSLRYNIQEEVSILCPNTIEKCFQLVVKIKEKIKRRQENSNRGRGGRTNQ